MGGLFVGCGYRNVSRRVNAAAKRARKSTNVIGCSRKR